MDFKTCPVRVFGDLSFRGECPPEEVEQIAFFTRLRAAYPTTWGLLALHPRNEQVLRGGQFGRQIRQKLAGLTPGTADIIIPSRCSFVCELKRQDHTKSRWQPGQQEFLRAAEDAGAFACIALGAAAGWDAFNAYLQIDNAQKQRVISCVD